MGGEERRSRGLWGEFEEKGREEMVEGQKFSSETMSLVPKKARSKYWTDPTSILSLSLRYVKWGGTHEFPPHFGKSEPPYFKSQIFDKGGGVSGLERTDLKLSHHRILIPVSINY